MMLFAFLVALMPSVYGAPCEHCDVLAFQEAVLAQTTSGDCDYASIDAPDCDTGATLKQAAVLTKQGCDVGGATRDAIEQGQQSAVDTLRDTLQTQGIDCDSAGPASGGGNAGANVECTEKNKAATNKDGTPKYPQCQDGGNAGGNAGNAGNAKNAGDATPAPTTESAANGVVYKFAIVVSAAFAYFLF